ncbi:MAG: rhodanese-like domain-containing protein [Nakamurella sp.]
MRSPRIIVVPALLALVLTGCSGTPANPVGSPPSTAAPAASNSAAAAPALLDPAAFAAAMAEPGTVTIDVHVPFEGKLNANDRMIPFDQIPAHLAELPADHDTPLAVYCRSGNMSAQAVPELTALGYTHIVELDGGMNAWVTAGRALITTS